MQREHVWIKIWRNRLSRLGVIIMSILLLLAFAAFLIAEDSSPTANEQHPEVTLMSPGFNTTVVTTQKHKVVDQPGWTRYLSGAEKPYSELPVKSAIIDGGDIVITTYTNVEKIIDGDALFYPELRDNIRNKSFLLGTDRYGRSIFSRLLLGIRISLLVGLFAVIISLVVGTTLGLLGGYFGGWIDRLIMYFINVTWSIPTLLLVFAIVLALGRGLGIIILAIGLTMWVEVARIVRGQVKKIKEEAFVMAAKSTGVRNGRILFFHILPNIIGPILVIGAANFASAILIEAGLSYLGFGVKPPTPSIGTMLSEHYGYAISGKPIMAIIPAVTIMLLVLGMNLLGSGLRDVFDVKSTDR